MASRVVTTVKHLGHAAERKAIQWEIIVDFRSTESDDDGCDAAALAQTLDNMEWVSVGLTTETPFHLGQALSTVRTGSGMQSVNKWL